MRKTKLVESLGVTTKKQFNEMIKKCLKGNKVHKKNWIEILELVILSGLPYESAGNANSKNRKSKQSVYEMLKVIKGRMNAQE